VAADGDIQAVGTPVSARPEGPAAMIEAASRPSSDGVADVLSLLDLLVPLAV
jgi:hypothetical protein